MKAAVRLSGIGLRIAFLQLVALEEVLAIKRSELADRLVCVASDSASVNLGSEKGIITRLRDGFSPRIENVHCYGRYVQVFHSMI